MYIWDSAARDTGRSYPRCNLTGLPTLYAFSYLSKRRFQYYSTSLSRFAHRKRETCLLPRTCRHPAGGFKRSIMTWGKVCKPAKTTESSVVANGHATTSEFRELGYQRTLQDRVRSEKHKDPLTNGLGWHVVHPCPPPLSGRIHPHAADTHTTTKWEQQRGKRGENKGKLDAEHVGNRGRGRWWYYPTFPAAHIYGSREMHDLQCALQAAAQQASQPADGRRGGKKKTSPWRDASRRSNDDVRPE